jgi:ribosomal protein S18 acetylase RimI-like enzyme
MLCRKSNEESIDNTMQSLGNKPDLMSADLKEVLRLNRSQSTQATSALIASFWIHPPLQYYYPDETDRKRIAPYFFSVSILYGIQYGEVYATSPDFEGIAVWLPSDNYPITTWRLLRSVPSSELFGLGRYGGAKMRNLGTYLDTIHSRVVPFKHWYLQAIGVAPQFQGKGYASTLLRSMLTRIDQESLPCYLETLEEQNVPLYEHFGFKVVDKSSIPQTSLTNWAMLRETQ